MKELEKILEEIEEATRQEDAPIYCGDMEVDGYVRMSVVEKIIRKYINDGWIPVEERLPERSGGWQVSCYEVTIILNGRHLVTTAAYDYSGRKWMTKSKVIAWRPLPEPYRPERSEGE